MMTRSINGSGREVTQGILGGKRKNQSGEKNKRTTSNLWRSITRKWLQELVGGGTGLLWNLVKRE